MSASPIGSLLRHAWARHRVPLVAMTAAAGLFEFIFTRMAPDPAGMSWMSVMLKGMPPELLALLGNEVALSPSGFLAIGYAHPFFMLLLSVWIVRTSSAAVAGEIGAGTMDLLASRPVPRWHFIAAGAITIAAGLVIIILAACAGTSFGLHLRQIGLNGVSFLPVALGAWLLFLALGAIGLLVGSTRRDGGQAIGWTTGLVAASFVLDYLARVWSPIQRLRPFSLFRYYEPQAILASGLSARTIVVFVATTAVAFAAGVMVVDRRDL